MKSFSYWKGSVVADIGCGDGALSYLLLREGAFVISVDPNVLGLEFARREFRRRGVAGTFESSLDQLPSNHFDVAVCADVIEHVKSVENLLSDMTRIVKPGGKVVISTPVRLTEKPLDPEHVREYFPFEFQSIIQQFFANVKVSLHVPIAGLMLYYWRPWFFLRRPLISYLMNILDICFAINCVAKINALDRYHTMMVGVGEKPSSPIVVTNSC